MAKSTWRDRFEFALQTAIERSSGVRELASRGIDEGARQLGAWQERQRQAELFHELGRATWQLAQAGRLREIENDTTVAHVLSRLAEDGGAAGQGRADDSFSDAVIARASAGFADGRRPDRDDDGTVSSMAGRTAPAKSRTPWTSTDDLDAAELAAFMHPDDLESR